MDGSGKLARENREWQPWQLGTTIAWLALLGVTAYLWQLGSIGLIDETEPLFAGAARQMVETGDWLTPYFNESTRFDKPPLIYWLMAVSYHFIGSDEWAVRLPSALSAIALVAFCSYALRSFAGWYACWLGAGILALNLQAIVWGRIGVADMLLCACIGGTLLCFFCGYAANQPGRWHWWPRGWYWGMYCCCALAVLTKGPVGLVLPGIVVLSFVLYTGQWRAVLGEIGLPGGLLLLGAIALPWFAAIAREHGRDYIDTFFGYHNLERFTRVVNRHKGPWYFYFGVVALGFAPWSAYLPYALVRQQFWRRQWHARQPRSAQLGLFATFWFAAVFCFFTAAATKLPSYTLPLLPAAAILVALAVFPTDRPAAPSPDRGLQVGGWLNVALALTAAIVLWLGPGWIGHDPAAPDLGERLARSGLPQRGSLIWLLAALGTAAIAWQSALRRWIWVPSMLGFLAFAWFFLAPTYIFLDAARQLPLRQLAEIGREATRPQEHLIMVGLEKPSFVFYSRQPTIFIRKAYQGLDFQQTDLRARPSAVFLGNPNKLERIRKKASRSQLLAQRGPYQLVRIWY